MNIINSVSTPGESTKRPNNGRRNFMWKIGGAMTAVLASTVPVMSKPMLKSDTNLKSKVDRLSSQLGMLQDEKEIRNLHKAYEEFLDKGMYGEVQGLFTDNAEVIFNGGTFKSRKNGINRLFCKHFKSGLTGKRIEPAPGFAINDEQQAEMVEVALDRSSATAKFTYSIQVGAPIVSDSLLVKMANLQGEGIQKWWEGGVYEVSYVKDAEDGSWKIKRLEYKTLSRADYKPGRSYAKPISVNQFSKLYPHEPTGPDGLVTRA